MSDPIKESGRPREWKATASEAPAFYCTLRPESIPKAGWAESDGRFVVSGMLGYKDDVPRDWEPLRSPEATPKTCTRTLSIGAFTVATRPIRDTHGWLVVTAHTNPSQPATQVLFLDLTEDAFEELRARAGLQWDLAQMPQCRGEG